MSSLDGRGGYIAVCAALFAAALLLLTWTRTLALAPLLASTAVFAIAAALVLARARRYPAAASGDAVDGRDGDGRSARRAERFARGAVAALAIAHAAAFLVDHRLDRLADDWDRIVATHEAQRGAALERRFSRLIERAERAAAQAARLAARADGADEVEAWLGELERIRSGHRVAALAIFDADGELRAWAGDHRGPVPLEAKRAGQGIVYAERPLFGYVYASAPIDERGNHALAAVLIQTGLALEAGGPEGFAEEFARRTGSRPYFGPGPVDGADWSLVIDGDTIAHASFDPVSQAEWRDRIGAIARRVVVPLVLIAIILAGIGWLSAWRATQRASTVPLLALAVALGAAPLGGVIGPERLFSPGLFLLPAPGEISLGRLLALLIPLAALAAVARPITRTGRAWTVSFLAGAVVVGLGFAGVLKWMTAGAGPSLLEGGPYLWAGLFPAALLALTIVTALCLPSGRPSGLARAPIIGGVVLSIALGAAILLRWRVAMSVDPWMPALWAVPFALIGLGISGYQGRLKRFARWLLAGWLAASAVVPTIWVTEVQANLRAAEREIATLGVNPDPFLDYMLRQFAAEAQRRHRRGEHGVELLYRSWVASGLAREAYPARITLFRSEGSPVTLDVGEATERRDDAVPAEVLSRVLERARAFELPALEPAPRVHGASQILAVPLPGGEAVTIVVRPRRSLAQPTILAPLFGGEPRPNTKLALVPATPDQLLPVSEIEWIQTDTGWRSETMSRYPDGDFHAHFELRIPPFGVRFARGVLLVAASLSLLSALWFFGRLARGEPPGPTEGWRVWAQSFRARVTIALFGFFLLPTVAFGLLAYRALAGEATRTARVVAERAVEQAVTAFAERPGDLRFVASRIGEEVLYYHRGELASASSNEVLELGLFGAWMPGPVYESLQSGEEVSVVETRRLGERRYVVAYRRLPAGTLAVPVSLSTGESAARQRELADLVLFAALLGGLLSLSLSVAVGRALAQPIGVLRRASAAVGAGRLELRLPESDAGEFGEVFASFNRMAQRLSQARAKEAHTARVLAWGEMSRQVAHEIKNPLTPIKLSVQHLKRAYADGRPDFASILRSNVDQILEEIDRLTEIARAFARYGAPDESAGPLQPVDVASIVGEALTLYRAGEEGVHFWAELEPDLPPVRARPGELKEVLLNLLENSYTALDGQGTIVVTGSRDGELLDLAVRDDGPGVPSELIERIFEPHFSTRSTGTGLGLAIVRRLVESWGGTVSAESEEGQGATFRMRLPIAEEAAVAAGVERDARDQTAAGEVGDEDGG